MKNRIAVISDIHGNADALQHVLDEIANQSIQQTVFLGDTLTYGMQPRQVLDLLKTYSEKNDVVFIKGNHDQFYFDIQQGQENLAYQVPDFVEESIQWTLTQIANQRLDELFNWQEHHQVDGVFFSHANPFGYGNWEYIEDAENTARTFKVLADKSCHIGVFGHSHRQLIAVEDGGTYSIDSAQGFVTKPVGRYIVNAGTVGQPRGNGFCYLTLEVEKESTRCDLHPFVCDISNNVNLISASSFSSKTKDKLISYLRS